MRTTVISTIALLAVLSAGCLKNKSLRTYTIKRPVHALKPDVRDNIRMGSPREIADAGNFVLYQNTMFINDRGRGIHVVDYSNASSPVRKGFIPIPGNRGLAIRNNVLYADCYNYLLVLKIHAPDDIRYESEIRDVFPGNTAGIRESNDAIEVIWISTDTTVTEEEYNNLTKSDVALESSMFLANTSIPGPVTGGNSVGSSMAVFAVVNDYLYTVDQSNLSAFSLADPLHPERHNTQVVSGGNVETIFPFSDKLFVGTRTGMFMYSISNPAAPAFLSMYQHVRVCDPVIAEEKFAYVTLRSGSGCGGVVNSLDVLNIENVTSPVLVRSYSFSNPHGLSKDGKVLFLCDGEAGLRVLDASDPADIKTVKTVAAGTCRDVVAIGQIAFVMLDDAIQIYSYDQQFNVQPLGSISK